MTPTWDRCADVDHRFVLPSKRPIRVTDGHTATRFLSFRDQSPKSHPPARPTRAPRSRGGDPEVIDVTPMRKATWQLKDW